MRRDAHVAGRHAVGEGVLDAIENGGFGIKAHDAHELASDVKLHGFRHAGGEERRLGLGALSYLVHKWHDGSLDLVEEPIIGGRVHAALVLIEPYIVRVARRIDAGSLALKRGEDAIDVRGERFPVVRELRFVPDSVRFAGELRPRCSLFGGNGNCLALLAGEDAKLGCRLLVEFSGGCRLFELGN